MSSEHYKSLLLILQSQTQPLQREQHRRIVGRKLKLPGLCLLVQYIVASLITRGTELCNQKPPAVALQRLAQ